MPTAVSLSQMVDLSLGTPEIGSVNFNVMHTLLHAIIKKLNIGESKAEINENDRDFLSTSKFRARSMLSDADSGRGEDSEDAVSEKSGVGPFRPSPYHTMELKVEKLMQQMEDLNNLPSSSELFSRTTKSKGDSATERPVADMWQYMQLKKRVDANEEGVGKVVFIHIRIAMATAGEANNGSSTPGHYSTIDNGDVYWQVGKTAMDSLHNIYERNLWTDVSIRCKDHVTGDQDDRLRAHKIILAARSPVFSAMFYGPSSNGSSELDLTEYSKTSVDAFLRYLYCDVETVQTDIAAEVFKLAHFYQVSTLVERCCDVLSSGLTTENACSLLEMAMLYDTPVLKDCIIDFIDEHAEAVLNSDGFLSISSETLEFMLKGDTLFADESVIVTQVYRWAKSKLTALNKKLNRRNVRDLLGRSSYLLRIPRMSLEEFLDLESMYCFHTRKECLDIAKILMKGKHQEMSCHTHEIRVAKTELVSFTEDRPYYVTTYSSSFVNSIDMKPRRSITVSGMAIVIPPVAIKYRLNNSGGHAALESLCPLRIKLECRQASFEQIQTITAENGKEVILILDPRLSLECSENIEYTLKVTVDCPMISNLCFKTTKPYNMVANASENEDIPKFTLRNNSLIKRLMFSRSSGRNRNVAESEVNISCHTYSEECDGKFETERLS